MEHMEHIIQVEMYISFLFIRKRQEALVDIVNKLTVLFSVLAKGAVSIPILSTVIAEELIQYRLCVKAKEADPEPSFSV